MKNISLFFLVLTLAILTTSCDDGDHVKNTSKEFERYNIITIDGCEYLQYATAYGYMNVTHKGNCKNVEHACK
ncbi:hypothetical protein KC929_03230 [Patescibacteria group bacterium]|nr:hypothetical protein [Patescibacteria group bacterium]